VSLHEESTQPTLDEPATIGSRGGDGPEEWDLWLIDYDVSMLVRCRCLDSSGHGMRLHVPCGCDIATGQRYEICPYLPGERPPPGCGLIGSAWITVARVRRARGAKTAYKEVEVLRDSIDAGVPSRSG
jgi:hypothetical protein